MKGFLVDTNIPSEMTRPCPEQRVVQWLEDASDDLLYISVITLGEVLKGIAALPESRHRRKLQKWLNETLRPWFHGRILPVNESIAERWGSFGRQLQIEREASEGGRRTHRRNCS
jgi:predicted nucleic acid-binding protein